MGKKVSAFLAGLATLSAMPAMAQDSGFYAFVNVGQADAERVVGAVNVIDGDDVTYDLGAGYTFGRYLSVQAAYHDFGEMNAIAGCPPEVLCIADDGTTIIAFSPDEASIDGVSLQLIGRYPLQSVPVDFFAKVGTIAWDSDWRHAPGVNESETDFMFGGGASWRAIDRVSVQLQYEKVNLDMESFTVGATFHF